MIEKCEACFGRAHAEYNVGENKLQEGWSLLDVAQRQIKQIPKVWSDSMVPQR